MLCGHQISVNLFLKAGDNCGGRRGLLAGWRQLWEREGLTAAIAAR